MKNLSDNKFESPNFVRSNQKSSSANFFSDYEKVMKVQKLNKQGWMKLQTMKMKK